MVLDTSKHYPVLLKKSLALLPLNMVAHLSIVHLVKVDYTEKILSYKNTQVIALDRDIETKKAQKFIDKFDNRLIFKNKKFSQLDNLKLKNENIGL